MKDKSIILIGMPGVGKSTVGIVLAKVMGYDFTDSDLVIQAREGRLLKEIIYEDGIERFIHIEDEVNACIPLGKSVIATGGSAIYGQNSMERFYKDGIIVYMKLGKKKLKRRLGSLIDRGVVMKNAKNFDELFAERTVLYEKYAHIIVDVDGLTIRRTVEEILNKIKMKTDSL